MALRRGSILSSGPLHNCRGRFENGAVGGVVVTASHNSIYNGYKVYASMVDRSLPRKMPNSWQRGRWIPTQAPRSTDLVQLLDESWDERYRAMLASFRLSPHLVAHGSDLPIVYTGLHGTGALAVPPALEAFGFRNVHEVASQAIPDGDFPTVASPNPEEGPACEAVVLAEKVGASLVMGTDPDSDRGGSRFPMERGRLFC